jgi:hypothetical protein
MQPARLDGVELKYRMAGSGEPVLLIHGGFIADTFVPLLAEPRIIGRHRLIAYHRRGYGGSSRATAPFTIRQQAADAKALLDHLGIARAHVVGCFPVLSTSFSNNPTAMTARLPCRLDGHSSFLAASGTGSSRNCSTCCCGRRGELRRAAERQR